MTAFRLFLLLLVSTASFPMNAQSFLDWKHLAPGPHAVGFRAVAAVDPTRSFGEAKDLLGAERPQQARRPIQITLWYPAQPVSKPHYMTYGDYVALTEWEQGPEHSTASGRAAALQAFIQIGEPKPTTEQRAAFDRLFASPVWAIRNAAPAPGRHPAVVLGPGGNSPSTDNSVMAEYLASHGYVVVSCPSLGTESRKPTFDGGGPGDAEVMDTCTRDLEFLMGYLQDLDLVDPTHIGTAGFSWGGITNVLLAMKDSRVKAVISLDDAMDRMDIATARRFPRFQAERLRAPLLVLVSETSAKAADSDPSFCAKAIHGDTWQAILPGLQHGDFCALYGLLGSRLALERDWKTCQAGYETICRLSLDFLDAHLKGHGGAWHTLVQETTRVTFRAAVPPPPRPGQFLELLNTAGPTHALALFREVRKRYPAYIPCREAEFHRLGLRLLKTGEIQESIAVFTLGTEAYPALPGSHEHLAEALQATGAWAQAEAACRAAMARLDAYPEPERLVARSRLEHQLAGLAARIEAQRLSPN